MVALNPAERRQSAAPASVAITHKQLLCGAERGRAFHVHSQRPHQAQEMQPRLRLTRMRWGVKSLKHNVSRPERTINVLREEHRIRSEQRKGAVLVKQQAARADRQSGQLRQKPKANKSTVLKDSVMSRKVC